MPERKGTETERELLWLTYLDYMHELLPLGHYNKITCFSSTARILFLSTTCALIILLLARDCKNGASVHDSYRYKLEESATTMGNCRTLKTDTIREFLTQSTCVITG